MRVLVCGGRPLGILFYHAFLKAQSQVLLFDAGFKLPEAVLVAKNKKESFKINSIASLKGQKEFDLVLIFAPAYTTSSLARLLKPVCGDSTYIVSFQAGLENFDILSGLLGDDNLALGVTNQVVWPKKGEYQQVVFASTFLGRPDRKNTPALKKIRQMFSQTSINVKISSNIKSLIWSQLIISSALDGWGAVLQLKRQALIKNPHARTLVRMSLAEAERIARRKRIKLAYEDVFAKAQGICESTAEVGSFLQLDWEAGRKSEVDYFCGFIYNLGQDLNIPTPLNFILYQAIKAKENDLRR